MPRDKEKRAAWRKQSYEKNKERDKQKNKEYREKNKDAIREKNKEWQEKNKEKIKQRKKEYNEKNKEKVKQQKKEWCQSEAGKKSNRISNWKRSGLICDDYNKLYKQVINTLNCENCDVELTEDKRTTPTTRCMDHSRKTNLFRNTLCNLCNIRRREDNLI